MPRLTSLAAVLSLAALAGCVSPDAGVQQTATGQPPAATIDPRASAYGLFLAGQAALDAGEGDQAASYFAAASQKDSDAAFIKARAFQAALIAGDVPRAAALAPGPGEGLPDDQRLGQLVRAVEALAEGRGHEAQTIIQTAALTPPLDRAGKLVLPWAAAEAGDWKTALAEPTGAGDHITNQV